MKLTDVQTNSRANDVVAEAPGGDLRGALEALARGCRTFSLATNKHVGGGSSSAEFFTSLYFGGVSNLSRLPAGHPDLDHVVLSKGHAPAAYYFCLWLLGNFGPISLDQILHFGENDSPISRMPVRDVSRGIEMSTGALGQGLSFANGLALGARRQGRSNWTYVIVGDAECAEGQIWEAADTTARLGLKNITVLQDINGFGSGVVVDRSQWRAKWEAFGFNCISVDGHDVVAVGQALEDAKGLAPCVLLLETTKGRGLPAGAENTNKVHNKVDEGLLATARQDLAEHAGAAVAAMKRVQPVRPQPAAPTAARPQFVGGLMEFAFHPQGEVNHTKKFAGAIPGDQLLDNRVVYVTPDAVGNSGLGDLFKKYGSCSWDNPDSPIIECAIAEQDAVSLAAGLAAAGERPALFLMEGFVWRGLDSLRESIAYPRLPVVVVSTSGGLGDELGPMVQSDGCYMAVLSIPQLECFEACDINEANAVFRHALRQPGPTYIRLPHERLPVTVAEPQLGADILASGVRVLRAAPSPQLVILTAGSLLPRVLRAADRAQSEHGLAVRVLEVLSPTTLRRLDSAARQALIPKSAPSLVVHNGPSVALGQFLDPDSRKIANDGFGGWGADLNALYAAHGMSEDDIFNAVVEAAVR